MNCVLPFDMSPGCIAYHNKAFPLGILKANLKEYDLWMTSKFINCIYRKNEHFFDLLDNDIWGTQQGLTETQTISVLPEVVSNGYIDVTDLLEFMFQSGYYLTGVYNEYYIPRKKPYKEFNYLHDYVLFGFDDRKKVFLSAGYIDTQKYETFEINYSDYLESICKIGTSRVNLWFYKINKDFEVGFDIKYIVQQLENYINSVVPPDSTVSNDIYGIRVWDWLADYINKNANPFLDLRYTRLFMEHKDLMFARLCVLRNEGHLNNTILEMYYQEIVKPARLVHYLCLKYNLSHDSDINTRAYKIIKDINKSEHAVLNETIEQIKQK